MSSGRSGSTLLTSLLNSHPDIFFDSEKFHHDASGKLLFPKLYLKLLPRQTRAKNNKVYGVGLMTSQLLKYYNANEMTLLFSELEQSGWKIIYLRRENILESSVSYRRAHIDNEWFHSKSGNNTVELDTQDVVNSMKYRLMLHQTNDEILDTINAYKVSYEKDLKNGDWQNLMNAIFDFLDLKSVPVTTQLQKKTTITLRESISNFNELEQRLKVEGLSNYIVN
ncbi:MAG: hypothetical protein ACSHXF_06055 [Aquaticitalea sp.]